MSTFCERFKKACKGKRQVDVANGAGITATEVSKLQSGDGDPERILRRVAERVSRLADGAGMDRRELCPLINWEEYSR